jgi:hypothetical protein
VGRPGQGAAVSPAPVSAGARVPRPVLQGLIALVIYLAVFVVGFGLALVGGLNVPRVGQGYVDPNLFIWFWRWWPYAVTHGLNPLYSHEIGAPAGYNLAAWTTSTPSVALLMWPVTAAFGPIVSFNLTLLLAPPTAAWAAFVVARRLTGRFWPALLAGAVYGFNIYELAHDVSGQPNVTVTLLFPLLVYLVLLWWDGTLGRTGFLIWMAVALALEFYTFTEGFLDVTIVTAAALVAGFAVAGPGARRTVARLAGLIAVAYAGAAALASPYLLDELLNLPRGLNRNSPGFSLHLLGLVLPRSDRVGGLHSLAALSSRNPAAVYVGLPLLVLLLVFAVVTWSSKLTRLLVVTFAVVIALSVGPVLVIGGKHAFTLPWSGLWSLPIARSVEANRFILFGYLVLAIVLALWLAAPVRSRLLLAARWGLAVLALAAMFANLPTFAEVVVPQPRPYAPGVPSTQATNALPAFITDGLYRSYLKPGEIVVVLSSRGNAGMLFQANADFYFRNAGGFINASLNSGDALPPPVALLSDPSPARERAFFSYVRAAGVGAIIVERAWSEKWMYVFGKLGMPGTTVGGVTVYQAGAGQVAGLSERGPGLSGQGRPAGLAGARLTAWTSSARARCAPAPSSAARRPGTPRRPARASRAPRTAAWPVPRRISGRRTARPSPSRPAVSR